MSKIKLQIKNHLTGSILFEYEKENNTIKDTVIQAVKRRVRLDGAYLNCADLSGADIRQANLNCADLSGADLRCARLDGAKLSCTKLDCAKLDCANFNCADLSGADLSDAYLRGANFYCADLSDANLSGAYLHSADFRGAKNVPYIPLACPSDGAFIGWKKVNGCLVQLLIPEEAKRCSSTTHKCRCEFAKVVSITTINNGKEIQSIDNTSHSPHITYKVGEMVYPDSFDEDRWYECSHGIHFFINKQDAINY